MNSSEKKILIDHDNENVPVITLPKRSSRRNNSPLRRSFSTSSGTQNSFHSGTSSLASLLAKSSGSSPKPTPSETISVGVPPSSGDNFASSVSGEIKRVQNFSSKKKRKNSERILKRAELVETPLQATVNSTSQNMAIYIAMMTNESLINDSLPTSNRNDFGPFSQGNDP